MESLRQRSEKTIQVKQVPLLRDRQSGKINQADQTLQTTCLRKSIEFPTEGDKLSQNFKQVLLFILV